MTQREPSLAVEHTSTTDTVRPRRAVYLHPGEMIATRKPTAVKTILGSCISVCLWDGEHRVGGMNHFLLPYGAPSADHPGRFGSSAIPLLVAAMLEQGASAQHMQAKLFGGSSMIAGAVPRATHVGLQNLRIATEMLGRARIPVISSDIGGARGRKLVFHTDDGSVSLWEL